MKTYYFTVSSALAKPFEAAVMAADPEAKSAVYDILPECPIELHYCCRPSRTHGTASQKTVYIVNTVITRKLCKKFPGVHRIRTTPTYSRYHPGIMIC